MARSYHSCILLQDEDGSKKLWAVGGENNCNQYDCAIATTEVFDLKTRKWQSGKTLPFAVKHSALVEGNGKHAAYLIGGRQDGDTSSTILGLTRNTKEWEEVGSFERAREDHVALTLPPKFLLDCCRLNPQCCT